MLFSRVSHVAAMFDEQLQAGGGSANCEAPCFWTVADYAKDFDPTLDETLRYRMIVHDLPRRFHSASLDLQKQMLKPRPPLTERKWDALLAATAEHLAILHGLAAPAWIDEPERFLRIPWIIGSKHCTVFARSVIDNRPPFYRHGVLPDPRDFDARGGERPYAAVISR